MNLHPAGRHPGRLQAGSVFNRRKPGKPCNSSSLARQETYAKRVEWTVEEILADLRAIATDPAQRPADRLKAYELGGKHLGMFTENIHITRGVPITEVLGDDGD